jgi:ABC-2 type transport system permease protein
MAWTALSLSVNERELLDLRRLLVYPVPPGRLYLLAVASAAAADPLALFMGLALVGAVVGALAGRPGTWIVPFAALVAAFAAATVAVIALLQELMARLARRRLVKELAILAGVGGWLALAVGGTAGARAPLALARGVRSFRWIMWPPALASEAARHLYGGHVAQALPWIVALGAGAAVTTALAYRVALGTARSGGEEAAAGFRSRRGRAAGWAVAVGPLLEKELRYLSRHPLARISVALVPGMIAFLAWRGGARIQANPSEILRALPLFGVAAYAHLALQIFWLNGFGWDRGGARTFFLAPLAPARVLAAKNGAVAVASLVLFLVGSAAWLAIAGAPPRWALPAALVLHLAMAPALHALGNVVTIMNPRGAPFGVQRGGALSQLSGLAGMAIFSGVTAVFAVPILAAAWLDAPSAIVAGWALLGAAALATWRAALPVQARLLVRRREQLLAAVCGDDA